MMTPVAVVDDEMNTPQQTQLEIFNIFPLLWYSRMITMMMKISPDDDDKLPRTRIIFSGRRLNFWRRKSNCYSITFAVLNTLNSWIFNFISYLCSSLCTWKAFKGSKNSNKRQERPFNRGWCWCLSLSSNFLHELRKNSSFLL